jgi:hypothetical protein
MLMKRVLVLAALFAALAGGGGGAVSQAQQQKKDGDEEARELAQRDAVVSFLRKHVIGKTVVTKETVFKYAGNKVEGVASGKDSYSNLAVTGDGLRFDVVSVNSLTNYDLDEKGKRIEPGRDEGGVFLTRYDLSRRRSTGKLVGTARIVSSTHKTYTAGYTTAVLMELAGGDVLTSKEHSIFYEDFFETKGKWKAGAGEAVVRFTLSKGRLRVEGENLQFDVDPKTMKRTRTDDPPMKWVSEEVAPPRR